MKISFSTIAANLTLSNGYGYAGFNMIRSLQRLGHEVPFQDPSCPVEIAFNQPIYTEWTSRNNYHIQYTPWESTELPYGWLEGFNSADEVWTPSPLVGRWYKEAGVTVPIRTYEHGLDHIWGNQRRRREGVLRFLHHGEPAPRKGGQMAVDAFREAFGDSEDVHLTVKSYGVPSVRNKDRAGNILGTIHSFNNVSLIQNTLDEKQLVELYHRHHALVYPGWGEGFGLIPLQAMGTGMPTICTGAWAPYERFLLPDLTVSSRLVDSPWPNMHPGQMFKPSFEDLVKSYRALYENYDKYAGRAYRNGFDVHKQYDWDALTESAFAETVERFS